MTKIGSQVQKEFADAREFLTSPQTTQMLLRAILELGVTEGVFRGEGGTYASMSVPLDVFEAEIARRTGRADR